MYQFKPIDSAIKAYPLFLCNVNKIGLNWYVYDFSVCYGTIDFSDIQDFHKYLMEKITI